MVQSIFVNQKVHMWDSFETNQQTPETDFFDTWIEAAGRTPEIIRNVRDAVFAAEAVAPEVTMLRTTPQSPPYHAEGPMVIDHLERMLIGLFAIMHGRSLLHIEEFAREQAWHPMLHELEQTIREHPATLEAFVFMHDLAKASTISFASPAGSDGAGEGFVKEARLAPEVLSARYGKLVRAFEAQHDPEDAARLVQGFYDQQQIRVHYYGHATQVMNDQYDVAREALSDHYRLTDRDREVLALMIRSHIDVIKFFSHGPDPAKMSLLIKRANKVGLDGDDVLDLQLAALLLDTTIGSLRYQEGRSWVDIDPVRGFVQSEQLGAPQRHTRRLVRLQTQKQRALKSAMERGGIDAMQVIELLGLPVGPERAEILQDIRRLVEQVSTPIPLQTYPTPIVQGIARARALYQSENRR